LKTKLYQILEKDEFQILCPNLKTKAWFATTNQQRLLQETQNSHVIQKRSHVGF